MGCPGTKWPPSAFHPLCLTLWSCPPTTPECRVLSEVTGHCRPNGAGCKCTPIPRQTPPLLSFWEGQRPIHVINTLHPGLSFQERWRPHFMGWLPPLKPAGGGHLSFLQVRVHRLAVEPARASGSCLLCTGPQKEAFHHPCNPVPANTASPCAARGSEAGQLRNRRPWVQKPLLELSYVCWAATAWGGRVMC